MEQMPGNILYYCCVLCKDGLHIHTFPSFGTALMSHRQMVLNEKNELLYKRKSLTSSYTPEENADTTSPDVLHTGKDTHVVI